jgi:hypothetical protein
MTKIGTANASRLTKSDSRISSPITGANAEEWDEASDDRTSRPWLH